MAERVLDPSAVETEVAHLRSLDVEGLRARWHTMMGRRPPPHLPRHLLFRILAYRLQADAFGNLDRNTRRLLDRMGAGPTGEPDPAANHQNRDDARVRPGTILVREWNGALQRVTVLDTGFAWNGATYASLSKVAYAITGTRWNGPRFFGLRAKGALAP
ncbi:MAG: DUF2924 domain-containing protein [Rhodoplanes sp.]|uniref:DUF2924 domain-containing protein n=1 Tax=Rhodoplanes sp. TaxID=1968906 RepID=UPI0018515A4E|nr:DUF2924 domain-containing protein [Rhodoplanes sp.]NVO17649.1 DUF2924 domain-containing protein [Rhodoplanes sp.]